MGEDCYKIVYWRKCDEKEPSWEDGKNPVEEGYGQGS